MKPIRIKELRQIADDFRYAEGAWGKADEELNECLDEIEKLMAVVEAAKWFRDNMDYEENHRDPCVIRKFDKALEALEDDK